MAIVRRVATQQHDAVGPRRIPDAVAIGPEVILPSEWLPVLWGGGAPEFKDQMQAQRIMKTILGRYNEILSTLQTDPDAATTRSGWCWF
jgi:yecA family protein